MSSIKNFAIILAAIPLLTACPAPEPWVAVRMDLEQPDPRIHQIREDFSKKHLRMDGVSPDLLNPLNSEWSIRDILSKRCNLGSVSVENEREALIVICSQDSTVAVVTRLYNFQQRNYGKSLKEAEPGHRPIYRTLERMVSELKSKYSAEGFASKEAAYSRIGFEDNKIVFR
jgi:hypothetical protein